jgi:hypothetical protein
MILLVGREDLDLGQSAQPLSRLLLPVVKITTGPVPSLAPESAAEWRIRS